MAISLSDLTGASTSGNVLNEVNSYADFLDSVPRLVNKADPSGATDAVQTVATKQPIALPLDANGKGYLYLSGITGNYASVPDANNLDGLGDFVIEVKDVYLTDWGNSQAETFVSKWVGTGSERVFIFRRNGIYINFYASYGGVLYDAYFAHGLTGPAKVDIKITRSGTSLSAQINTGSGYTSIGSTLTVPSAALSTSSNQLEIGTYWNGSSSRLLGKISHVKIWDNATQTGSPVLDIDFTSPRIPHGATEFTCETGQVVTVNTSGNNPAKVIKKSVLRYDGVDDFMNGVFGQTVTGGYMFAAFSVNGDGGNVYGRILGLNSAGSYDSLSGGVAFRRNVSTTGLMIKYNGNDIITHSNFFDDERGDYLLEAKVQNNSQQSKVNNADADNGVGTATGDLSAEEFAIASLTGGGQNEASIDLEYLAFFPSLTDSQADQVRNFINNRNSVFLRHDTDGYYFFDGAATTDGQVFTGSGSWNGRIVGSDNGDSDFYISQNTLDDRPTTDGYKITFADNTDHFDIPSTTQAGWQIVGTSLGTFAYKVDSDAITELNLLGNAAAAVDALTYRKAGDLYGIILLPQNATNRDIEEARKLLIDRGASDGASVSSFYAAWYKRRDVVEFRATMPQATDFRYAWKECTSLTSFSTQLPEVTNAQEAWYNNASLSSFTTTDLKNCSNFSGAWQFCTSLTQFPKDAKLGTEVTGNVDFTEAWRATSLTSFSTPLPTATTLTGTWRGCPIIESFSTQLPEATRVDYAWYNDTSLSSFTTTDLKNCSNFAYAWRGTSSLTQFPQDAKLGTEASNVSFTGVFWGSGLTSFSTPMPTAGDCFAAFYECSDLETFDVSLSSARNLSHAWGGCSSLTDFSANVFANWNPSSIVNFNNAWTGCTSLTAQSVENILVPIANSGKWATSTGLEGGTALSDATIDIDYNVATGSLTAATLSAIETLNGRGWSVNINNQIIVPNILQLQPAAAYSLRSFDSDADPTVVNVRRSSDGALSDFTASQVSDGTLRDWTLGDTLALDGQRMHFDGIDDKVDVSSLDISNLSEITIKTRILWQNGIDANEGIFTNGSTSSDRFGLYVSNQLTFYIGDGTQTFYPNLVSLNTNQYYDVVATAKVENGQMTARMFVDGVADNETFRSTSATDFSVVAQNWVIGYLNVNRYFKGIIDYVEVYEGYSTDGSVTGMTALHKWSNTNITNASWVDQVGSADGTVNGTPALFSGQGFDGYVTTFYDQSTNGRDSTQSTASAQPLIVENGVLLTDSSGNPAIVGDGVDDTLVHPTLTNELDSSDFLVTAAYKDEVAMGIEGAVPRLYMSQSSMSYNTLGTVGYASQIGRNILSFQVLGNTQEVFGNGISLGTASETQVDIGQSMFNVLRAGSNFSGKPLMEVVVFGNDQSAQRSGIEKNINDYLGIY